MVMKAIKQFCISFSNVISAFFFSLTVVYTLSFLVLH